MILPPNANDGNNNSNPSSTISSSSASSSSSSSKSKTSMMILVLSLLAVFAVVLQILPMIVATSNHNNGGNGVNGGNVRSAAVTANANVNGYTTSSGSSGKIFGETRDANATAGFPAKSTAALPASSSTSISSITTNEPTSITSITPESSEFLSATSSLPIYLLNTSINATAVTTWGTLLKSWNRTAEYSHLWNVSTEIPSLPYPLQHSQQSQTQANTNGNRRTIILIHCGPKTGSTTLRVACKKNYERTCPMHAIHPPRTHEPLGYMDESKLYPLIDKCRDTTHFCAKEITIPPSLAAQEQTSPSNTQLQHYPLYTNTTFLHLFPFRNYNEWSASALKQQFDRGHQKGCDKQLKLLQNNCTESHMELDLRKYGKVVLSKFKDGAVRRMLAQQKTMPHPREEPRERHLEQPGEEGAASSPSSPILSEQHIFLLYHHRQLNSVLSTLAHTYRIPTLPGSDRHGKSKRPEGTCDKNILKGCDKQLKLLQSNCTERQMELDLRKYGKAVLSKFKEGAVRRMLAQQKMHHLREQREQHLEPGDEGEGGAYANAASSPSSPILSEQHIFLLYHHRELNSVLSTLAHTYQIPTLPGSDGHGKSKRPEGTCDAKILEMFHACFSWELTELK
eukprot:CAMPEP_0183743514 /NCGR_PEP_ID=MMETSP0737-20130205/65258_1 /TAXON_ID=385413 /ORGANISM="Thalassiosira miniscula, Strain CCMP1093" /LENGTH=623 /DNA_ID=CAMNT_0025979135 /DNA_START=17 /DNA_END=1888 /DNA_ORIENTATION=+